MAGARLNRCSVQCAVTLCREVWAVFSESVGEPLNISMGIRQKHFGCSAVVVCLDAI